MHENALHSRNESYVNRKLVLTAIKGNNSSPALEPTGLFKVEFYLFIVVVFLVSWAIKPTLVLAILCLGKRPRPTFPDLYKFAL